ncbi:hypothetical protein OESDEN_01133 [Oesophagostomum dentatum]|uniref:Uncharacterized protein n=1 Tax=Oesophagostomum dentatum TaxID=61180 RepID=A0A0B1TNP2_OESDE|nr:hypothetical protein OESDEN_01133 [Oesophagostomum dentatum]
MSGPVTLESLAPANSASPDGSASTSGHIVSFNGQTTEVPEEIHCHLCNYPMKLCLRKTKYKGEIREYAAYRCLRKGCQTFRSVRKVIEPDYPYPRKRKPDESYEIFDSCGTGGNSGSSANEHSNEANDSDAPTGTLIYVKQEISTEQMEKMLEFDFKFFNEKPGSIAVERWEASHKQDQLQSQSALCPVQPAKLLAPTSTSVATFIPTIASSRPSQAQTLLPYTGLAPPLSPPPYPPRPSPSHPSVSCSYQPHNVFDPSTMYEYPSCGTSLQLSSMLSQSCNITSQSHPQNTRTQQYADEIIW